MSTQVFVKCIRCGYTVGVTDQLNKSKQHKQSQIMVLCLDCLDALQNVMHGPIIGISTEEGEAQWQQPKN